MQEVIDKFWNSGFCFGLIEWAESQSFADISSKPVWERGTESMIVFEDQKLANSIFEKIEKKLPQQNSYGRLMGVDDYLRLFRFNRGIHNFSPNNFTRSGKEKIFYRLFVLLNGKTEFEIPNIESVSGKAILTNNPVSFQLNSKGSFYLLMVDITYRK